MEESSQQIQRRTLQLLFVAQVLGSIGVGIGFSVGALLATEMAGVALSGLAQSAAVVGGALLVIPATRITNEHGRRPSLAATYLVATLGSVIVVAAATLDLVPVLFAGLALFGGASAASLQARYAAVDLAAPNRRGSDLSIVVWATTIGAVAGPNLAAVAGVAVQPLGIPTLAGPFAFSALAFGVTAIMLFVFLRPDPLLTSRARAAASGDVSSGAPPRGAGMRWAMATIRTNASAKLGIAATALGHVVMVGVMSMTPVHIMDANHGPAHTLRIVGIVLSFHIAGMFALAPVTGWLSDRHGRRPVILGGVALLAIACVLAGTAGHETPQLTLGLTLLGLGWSCTMVGGSTLLSDALTAESRASVQGLSDLTMGLAGASAGALSGLAMSAGGYPLVASLSALALIPLTMLVLRGRRTSAAVPVTSTLDSE